MSKWFPFFFTTNATTNTTTPNWPGIFGFAIAVIVVFFIARKVPVADKLVKGA